jgi:hypothetical protein
VRCLLGTYSPLRRPYGVLSVRDGVTKEKGEGARRDLIWAKPSFRHTLPRVSDRGYRNAVRNVATRAAIMDPV